MVRVVFVGSVIGGVTCWLLIQVPDPRIFGIYVGTFERFCSTDCPVIN